MRKELSQAQIKFSKAFEATEAYQNYRHLADVLERDPASVSLLKDLIRYHRQPPTEAEQVEFDQELQRNSLLLDFLAAERVMIDEYNRLADKYLGKPGIGCGSNSGGCSSGCAGCNSSL